MNVYKLIFWDFDGVIKESIEVKTKAFLKLFDVYGADLVKRIRVHHEANGGMSRFDKFPIYLKWAGEEPNQNKVDELCEKFKRIVFDGVIQSQWVPGAEEYLRQNPNNQIFVLVSATPQAEMEQIIKELKLESSFESIYGAPTSKFQAVLQTLINLDILPHEALMIGDAKADMNAAIDNNVPFLLRIHSSNRAIFAEYVGKSVNDLSEL